MYNTVNYVNATSTSQFWNQTNFLVQKGLNRAAALKWYYHQKIISFFPSDFESVLA